MEIKPTSPREAVVCSQNWACLSESRWNAEMDTKVEQNRKAQISPLPLPSCREETGAWLRGVARVFWRMGGGTMVSRSQLRVPCVFWDPPCGRGCRCVALRVDGHAGHDSQPREGVLRSLRESQVRWDWFPAQTGGFCRPRQSQPLRWSQGTALDGHLFCLIF